LSKRGIINRKTFVIVRAAIQVMGIDAWLVSGSDTVQLLENYRNRISYLC
jgi:hypothetical protein